MNRAFQSCKGCGDRYPGCHDHCEKYKKEREAWDAYKAKRDIDQGIRTYICCNSNKIADANAKKRKKTLGIVKFRGG